MFQNKYHPQSNSAAPNSKTTVCKFMTQHTILFVHNEIELVACFFLFLFFFSFGTECIAVTEVTLEAVGALFFFQR